MTVITTRLTVAANGAVSTTTPLPEGEYTAIVTTARRPQQAIADLPTHPGNWDDSISLSREDMYGDDGR